jgi:hypothetical protein
MLSGAIVFAEVFVKRFEEGFEFLQAVGDGAGGQIEAMAAQFGEDAVQRLKELEFVLQDKGPQGNADAAFGDELVGRWRREHARLIGAAAAAAIAFAVIAAAMSADVDFEDVAIGGAGNLLQRLAALSTRFLGLGQIARFVGSGEMLVIASTMPFAARLLPALAWRLVVGAIGIGRLGGGGFGFTSVDAAFQLAEFRFSEFDLFFPLVRALDGTLMLGLPIVRLLTEFNELLP